MTVWWLEDYFKAASEVSSSSRNVAYCFPRGCLDIEIKWLQDRPTPQIAGLCSLKITCKSRPSWRDLRVIYLVMDKNTQHTPVHQYQTTSFSGLVYHKPKEAGDWGLIEDRKSSPTVKNNECLNVNMANTEHIETWGNGSGMLLIILFNNLLGLYASW